MVNYFYDCYTILNKVYSEKAFLKQAIADTFIEEKNRSLTIKTVYGVLDKDIELSYYIRALAEKSPKLVIRTILKISMYAIKYLGKKSELSALLKQMGSLDPATRAETGKFVNETSNVIKFRISKFRFKFNSIKAINTEVVVIVVI